MYFYGKHSYALIPTQDHYPQHSAVCNPYKSLAHMLGRTSSLAPRWMRQTSDVQYTCASSSSEIVDPTRRARLLPKPSAAVVIDGDELSF